MLVLRIPVVFSIAAAMSLFSANATAQLPPDVLQELSKLKEAPEHIFIPSPLGMATGGPGTEKKVIVEATNGAKKEITFQAYTLTVNTANRAKLRGIAGLQLPSVQSNSNTPPILKHLDISAESLAYSGQIVPSTKVIQHKGIPSEAWDSIKKEIEKDRSSSISTSEMATAAEEKMCAIFDGKMRTLTTGVVPFVGKVSVAQVEVKQQIEDGIVFYQKAIETDGEIKLAVELFKKDFSHAETYTFDGFPEAVEIAIARSAHASFICTSKLKPGELLFVDPGFQTVGPEKPAEFAGPFKPGQQLPEVLHQVFVFSVKIAE